MNKADKFKLLYIFGISLIFYFIGCVDTSVQNLPTSVDYHSQIQIVNLASVSGAATVDIMNADGTMDGTTGQLNLGGAYPDDGQPFMDIPSGTKTFNITFPNNSGLNTSLKLTIDSQRKIRLLLINPDSSSSNIVKADERYTFQEKGGNNAGDLYPADSASIGFFNASLVTVDSIYIAGAPLDISSLAVGKGIGYTVFNAANYTITFKQDTTGVGGDPNLATATINAQSQGRYSAVLYGTKGNFQAKVYTDD